MRLTDREKILLVLLGGLAFLGIYFNFILLPQMENIKQLEKQKAILDNRIAEIEQYTNPNGQVQRNYNDLNNQVAEITANYFPEIVQEQKIIILAQMVRTAGVQSQALDFTPVTVGPVERRGGDWSEQSFTLRNLVDKYHRGPGVNNSVNSPNSSDSKDLHVERMEVKIQCQGTYSSIIELIDQIEGYSRKIHINRLDLTGNQNKGEITSNVEIHFYGLPKIYQQDKDLSWGVVDSYGRPNPFSR